MKKYFISKIVILPWMLIFTGCAAMLIPETKDPVEKIQWANSSLNMKRPIPAEKLLNEAIPILEQEKNIGMLGAAYNIYGRLDYSFPNKNDTNHAKAIANFEKSLKYLEEFFNAGKPDKDDKHYKMYNQWATNSAFCLGELYRQSNEELSCKYFDKSVLYYKKQRELSPSTNVAAEGFKSFEESIKKNKEKSNCAKYQK